MEKIPFKNYKTPIDETNMNSIQTNAENGIRGIVLYDNPNNNFNSNVVMNSQLFSQMKYIEIIYKIGENSYEATGKIELDKNKNIILKSMYQGLGYIYWYLAVYELINNQLNYVRGSTNSLRDNEQIMIDRSNSNIAITKILGF